jgi:hypothetical protein
VITAPTYVRSSRSADRKMDTVDDRELTALIRILAVLEGEL